MKAWLLAIGLLASGCAHDAQPPVEAPCGACTTVSGIAIDLDRLMRAGAAVPRPSAADAIAMSARPTVPVWGAYPDGVTRTGTVLADASGRFTLSAKENSTVRIVVGAQDDVVQTANDEPVVVGVAAVQDAAGTVYTSEPTSTLSGVAATLALPVPTLVSQGLCLLDVWDASQAPFFQRLSSSIAVAEAGFEVYGLVDDRTTPPHFLQQPGSPLGTFAIARAGLTAPTTVHVSVTIGAASPMATTCLVTPGQVSAALVSPSP